MMAAPHVFILAGGRGTRFWPLSRRHRPKQLLDFTGEGSLLAMTSERIAPLVPPERQWIITSEDLADAIREAVPSIPPEQVLAEPMGRNTAPAVGLAAALLLERGEDAAFAVLPSDHLITPASSFRDTLQRALEIAGSSDHLLTFGVKPDRAETGYGYIECGEAEGDGVRRVEAFREKPDRATAQAYLESGRHLWNSGIFAWRASVVAAGLDTHAPSIMPPLRILAASAAVGTEAFAAAFNQAYSSVDSISIDYALMEKASNTLVIDADFRWNDVGHWLAMRELWPLDADANATRGQLIAIDSNSNVVHGQERLTALIGVSNLVVVTTDEVTLVCSADRAQQIKLLLERLEAQGLDELL